MKTELNTSLTQHITFLRNKITTWGRGELYTELWWGNLKDRVHLGDPDLDRRIILRWIFRKWDVGVWIGSNWLRIGTGGGHL